MQKMNNFRLFCVLLCVILLTACGGGDSSTQGGDTTSVTAFTAADFNNQIHYLFTDTGDAWETASMETDSDGTLWAATGLVDPLVAPEFTASWEIDAQGRLHVIGEAYYTLAARGEGFLETCWGETPDEADACDSPEIWYTDLAAANAFVASQPEATPVPAFTAADFNDQIHYLLTDAGDAWETASMETAGDGTLWAAAGLVDPLGAPEFTASWEIDAQGRLYIIGEAYYTLAARGEGFLETCWGETPAEADACDSPEIWYADLAAAEAKVLEPPAVQ